VLLTSYTTSSACWTNNHNNVSISIGRCMTVTERIIAPLSLCCCCNYLLQTFNSDSQRHKHWSIEDTKNTTVSTQIPHLRGAMVPREMRMLPTESPEQRMLVASRGSPVLHIHRIVGTRHWTHVARTTFEWLKHKTRN